MILYPAIDLKGGECVRLRQGDPAKATVYSGNPAEQAKVFAEAGFTWLHVVDLDGAFAGASRNRASIANIREAVDLRIQLGGGIRSLDAIQRCLDAGIDRVILGTLAVKSPEVVRRACHRFGDQIAVGIDARQGQVAISGWQDSTSVSAVTLAKQMSRIGVKTIIHTEIQRDGMLQGLDLDTTTHIARSVPAAVIASGGLASLSEIEAACTEHHAPIAGVILGRALYDGRIDSAAALAIAANGLRSNRNRPANA